MACARLETGRSRCQVIRFDVLPDDSILDIFYFYVDHDTTASYGKKAVESWQTLVHVCRRWRSLVFGSPHRLTLRLFCTPKTRTKDTLDVWPALPIILHGEMTRASGTDNIIATLGQSNRVHNVHLLGLSDWQLEQVLAAMQVPFLELTDLQLSSTDCSAAPIIPDSFLGGSAPRLRRLILGGIPFPGLPNLLLSATHLIKFWLTNIPSSWYISPEALVASLSSLSSLEKLHLQFRYPLSRPDRETRRPPPPKRSILPALERFTFNGSAEYLEDLVSRIDAPRLDHLHIEFFTQIDSDYPRLIQFINRTPKHGKCDKVYLQLDNWTADVLFGILQITITCRDPDLRLLFVSQTCSILIPSMVEDLYIERQLPDLYWQDGPIETTSWLQVLLPFATVKNLYLYKEFATGIAESMRVLVGDRITEVLPSLQNIFVEEPELFEKGIEQFVFSRQLSGYPVAISYWSKGFDMGSM